MDSRCHLLSSDEYRYSNFISDFAGQDIHAYQGEPRRPSRTDQPRLLHPHPGGYRGYGSNCWGITAVDGPKGYSAYEPRPQDDDGTIAPTGAIASMPYTPEASMEALKFYYRELGDRLWGPYGFRDAFNLQENWFSGIYMGLNQAPMVIMIENYRTGLVWRKFMGNAEVRRILRRVGFEKTRHDVSEP